MPRQTARGGWDHGSPGAALAVITVALAVVVLASSCDLAPRDKLLADKSCSPQGECLAGYECDAQTHRCVPVGSAVDRGGHGGESSNGGGGTGGGPVSCVAEECPGIDTACAFRACDADGVCVITNAPVATACVEDAGQFCDGEGSCVACLDQECPGTEVCQQGECVPGFCADGIVSGDETDVDCGGTCTSCENGLDCEQAADCDSRYCFVAGGNGGVGGAAAIGKCTACSNAGHCAEAAGTYCLAGVCTDRKQDGDICDAPIECASGFCPSEDGVCCDSACDRGCEACLLAKTMSLNGTCAAITIDTDPDNECSDQGAATCAANGTGCNGLPAAPGCNLYTDQTICVSQGCVAAEVTAEQLCDGAGSACVPAPISCGAYACNAGGTDCRTTCAIDMDCSPGNWCAAPSCLPKKSLGENCGAAGECSSGICKDLVCCDDACLGLCEACDSAGACTQHVVGSDPDGDCLNDETCRSDATCGLKLAGESCGDRSECEDDNCPDGVCCNNNCNGSCEACDLTGTVGSCEPVPMGEDPDDECDGATPNCDGNGGCM